MPNAVEYRDGLGRSFWQPALDNGQRLYRRYDFSVSWFEWVHPGSVPPKWAVLYRNRKRALRRAVREERRRAKKTVREVREVTK